jgi:hypothetical protein
MSSSLRPTQQIQQPNDNLQEIITNMLFGHPNNIFNFYSLIKESLPNNVIFTNDICVVDNNPDLTRYTAKCKQRYQTTIGYDPKKIMLYGGAAYRMYLYYIMNKYDEYNIKKPQIHENNFIVNDLDLILWPDIIGPKNELFIYKQTKLLTEYYKEILMNIEKKFNDKKELFLNILKYRIDINNFKIIVSEYDKFELGTNTITISFIINDNAYKIIEFTIHDGASSQSVDKIIRLKPMELDPTYVNNYLLIPNNDSTNDYIILPEISNFVEQQIFAYNNLIKFGDSTISKTKNIMMRLLTFQKLLNGILPGMYNYITTKINPHSQKYENDVFRFNSFKSALNLINNFIKPVLQPSSPQPIPQPISYVQQPISYLPQQISYIQQPPLPSFPPRRGGSTKKKGHQLFNDNPRGRPRTKGIGYGTAKKARNSITRLKGKSKTYKRQVATTMYYRAKHHKYQNKGMRNAMKIWKKYINQLK